MSAAARTGSIAALLGVVLVALQCSQPSGRGVIGAGDASARDGAPGGDLGGGAATARVPCPTLADLAGGYTWSTSISGGDSSQLCLYVACESWGAGWEGGLYVGADGLFRMVLGFATYWSGGGGSLTGHVDGVARMDGCETLVLERLFDYAAGPGQRGCREEDFEELDSAYPTLRYRVLLLESGTLGLFEETGGSGFLGGEYVWRPDPDITAENVHVTIDESFHQVLCDPRTGRGCPPGGIGDPCTTDDECTVGRCSGAWCTRECATVPYDEAACDGACAWGQNTLGAANLCLPSAGGGRECFPQCHWDEAAAVATCSGYAGALCQYRYVEGNRSTDACATGCTPNSVICREGEGPTLVTCDAAGHGTEQSCEDVCRADGWGTPKGCMDAPGGAGSWCECDTASCTPQTDRSECLRPERVRVCETDAWGSRWAPKDCAVYCDENGLGGTGVCTDPGLHAYCGCDQGACSRDGATGCVGANALRVCWNGRWWASTCLDVCRRTGYGAPLQCGQSARGDVCTCDPESCASDGARECVDDATVRLCTGGNWLPIACETHCANYGGRTSRGCRWVAAQGAFGCVCE